MNDHLKEVLTENELQIYRVFSSPLAKSVIDRLAEIVAKQRASHQLLYEGWCEFQEVWNLLDNAKTDEQIGNHHGMNMLFDMAAEQAIKEPVDE